MGGSETHLLPVPQRLSQDERILLTVKGFPLILFGRPGGIRTPVTRFWRPGL
jgi:hypothetical protein